MRRKWFMSDSTEEVGPVSGISRTSPYHSANALSYIGLPSRPARSLSPAVTFLGQIVRSEERSDFPGYDETPQITSRYVLRSTRAGDGMPKIEWRSILALLTAGVIVSTG